MWGRTLGSHFAGREQNTFIFCTRKSWQCFYQDSMNKISVLTMVSASILWHVCWKPELWSHQRQPLLGNGSVNTPVARQRLSNITWSPQQTRTQAEDGVFYAVRAEAIYGESRHKRVSPSQESIESVQPERPVWVWGCGETFDPPGRGVGGGGAPVVVIRCVVTPSSLWDSRRPARTWIRKLRELGCGKPLPDNDSWRHSRLRRLSACCSEM
jgi:hypothetical protein